MLTSLNVRQFALIDEIDLELLPGMTVFSGETGAGKSILIDALSAVFGARARSEWVRHGAGKSEISAIWEGDDAQLQRILEQQDIEFEGEMVLRRVIHADGRSRAFVNGVVVPLKVLQSIGSVCLDLHGQHEHQLLLLPDFQRRLLDRRIHQELFDATARAHAAWQEAKARLHSFSADRSETEHEIDWMREELAKVEALKLEGQTVEQLEQEVATGRHHAQIQEATAEALRLMEENEPNIRSLLAKAMRTIGRVASFHPRLKSASHLMAQLDVLLGEVMPELRSVRDESFDELALREAEERLMQAHEAMRRHSTDEVGLLKLADHWRQKLDALETADWDEAELRESLAKAAAAYRQAARSLSRQRQKAGEELVHQLRPYLDQLALNGMQVRFEVTTHEAEDHWHARGWDDVAIMLMSNPGEPWRPLSVTISGGELSRFVLALKGCGALSQAPHIAVFDEVDSGIGGETAWAVGRLLALMGRERQVLVISHLPQVAALADQQVMIRKEQVGGRTVTRLHRVEDSERQQEIARMLGGTDPESLEHAERMLVRGQQEMD